jgi:4-hydroxybenzoate polyprenyltransferase
MASMTSNDERRESERRDAAKRIAIMQSIYIALAGVPIGVAVALWLGPLAGIAAMMICIVACIVDVLVVRKSQLFRQK